MRLEQNHDLGQPEAIRRIDLFLDRLIQHPLPRGLTIESPSKVWSGNVMTFSFKAKKGWLGATIAGRLSVNDHAVIFDMDLPGLVKAFVSEDEIQALLNQQFDSLLHA